MRAIWFGIGLTILATLACQDERKAIADDSVRQPPSRVDPMNFVLMYRSSLHPMLEREDASCEAVYLELRRFLSGHRQEYLRRTAPKPAHWQVAGEISKAELQAWMAFGTRCPRQILLFNKELYSL